MENLSLLERLSTGKAAPEHRPWPRFEVTKKTWEELAAGLGDHIDMMGLWADKTHIHMALFEPSSGAFAVASLAVEDNKYPSISRRHPPAMRLERTIRDLFVHEPSGLPDTRPWLDHGNLIETDRPLKPYRFLPAEGRGVHEIPVGPVHAGIIEPGHFRFTVNGETVVRLEQRLGYVHKGIEKLLEGKDVESGAKLCARVSGDSTVAYSIAYARAVEAALSIKPPARADWLRALMAELERLANHFGDIGAVCNDASFALLHAYAGILREDVLRAANACFGHRLMMDRVTPGGVVSDLSDEGKGVLYRLISSLAERFDEIADAYDNTASLKDRTWGTGILPPDLARQYAAGGVIGRASKRSFDSRKSLPYPPYDQLEFSVPTVNAGDVNARIWIRLQEVKQSLSLVRQILDAVPRGDFRRDLPKRFAGEREGMGVVEGFRGDILVWLRLAEDGRLIRCHPRDPSWFQWPLLEAVVKDNIVADFPLCNKSFNCSYSGHDL